MNISIKGNFKEFEKKLNRVIRKFPKEIDAAIKTSGAKTAAEVKRRTPKRGRELSRQITSQRSGNLEYTVKARGKSEKYVGYVEEGTGIYGPNKRPITPKNPNGVLVWRDTGKSAFKKRGRKSKKGSGNMVFAKSSKGFKGFFMFRDAEKPAIKVLRDSMLKMVRSIAKKL